VEEDRDGELLIKAVNEAIATNFVVKDVDA